MTRYLIAAGALLMGTSPVALAATLDMNEKGVMQSAVSTDTTKSATVNKDAKLATTDKAKFEMASLDTDLEKLAFAENAKVQTAAGKTETGMGGPLEEVVDLVPGPATMNYPPCDPGPGDDRCIQLYEPGVRAALASWNRPTGGLAGAGETELAMGGPDEPLDKPASEAEAQLASVYKPVATDTEAMGGPFEPVDETVDKPVQADLASVYKPGIETAHHQEAGIGGPIESQSGYPPCDPGPGDDRCIQLYEPGVTGAGN